MKKDQSRKKIGRERIKSIEKEGTSEIIGFNTLREISNLRVSNWNLTKRELRRKEKKKLNIIKFY